MNKKGWMLILEATIAVMIVAGVLIVAYSKQGDGGVSREDYFYSLQGQILADVSASSDLRLNVLNVNTSDSDDGNLSVLNDFIRGKIPGSFGYSIRVCVLGDISDYCKMKTDTYIATMDKDIYVEEIIIAAELGSGVDAVYSPKKLRLFVWEGCADYCSVDRLPYCSTDLKEILIERCGNFDDDDCLELREELKEICVVDEELCKVDECVPAWANLSLMFSGVVYSYVGGVNHTYTHNRTLTESNGVGVDLTEGQICYERPSPYCDLKGVVNYVIEADGTLVQLNKRFWTNESQNEFTLKYWGIDDNGNGVYVEQSLCVDGSSFTVNC